MAKHATGFALAIFLLVPHCPAQADKAKLAIETARIVVKRFPNQTVPPLARQIEQMAKKHGEYVFPAVRNVGHGALPLIAKFAGYERHSAYLMAKYGEDAMWVVQRREALKIFVDYGDDAAEALIKHLAAAELLILRFKEDAVRALQAVSPQSGLRLAIMAKRGELTPDLLVFVAKYEDRAVDYVWNNKIALTGAGALAALVANPTLLLGSNNATPPESGLKIYNDARSRKLIIFVPGLGGNSIEAFTARGYPSWLQLMKTDQTSTDDHQLPLSRYSTGVLNFPSSVSDQLRVTEIALNLITDLKDKKVFEEYEELYFIAHSLGGLVLMEMLTQAASSGLPLATYTKAAFLISVPSQGAPAANFLEALLGSTAGPLVSALKTIDKNNFLLSLQKHWHGNRASGRLRLRVFCAYERKSTRGLLVVPSQFTDTHCDMTLAVNEDHISIVKPKSVDVEIYRWVRHRIAEVAAEAHLR